MTNRGAFALSDSELTRYRGNLIVFSASQVDRLNRIKTAIVVQACNQLVLF